MFNKAVSYRFPSLLLDTDFVRVADVRCRAPCSAEREEDVARTAQVIVPRRGVFTLRSRGEPVVADPNTAVVLAAGDEYCVTHPVSGGDDCTVFVFAPDVLESALGTVPPRQATVSAQTQLATTALTVALRPGVEDALEAEEFCIRLLARFTADLRALPAGRPAHGRMHQRRRVEAVRELVAGRPEEGWHLAQIAHAVHCSPFHLARQFRELTGESIASYVLRLRLAMALDRLADGETSLTRLAVDCGFAHHSHFSKRFRPMFGVAPATARTALTRPQLRELSRIVTAPSPAGP